MGVSLLMPGVYFTPGSSCWLAAIVCNTGPVMNDTPVFVALDVFGDYWFAPSWINWLYGIDYYTRDLLTGETIIVALEEFSWPEISDQVNGLVFIGLMTDPDITTSISTRMPR